MKAAVVDPRGRACGEGKLPCGQKDLASAAAGDTCVNRVWAQRAGQRARERERERDKERKKERKKERNEERNGDGGEENKVDFTQVTRTVVG